MSEGLSDRIKMSEYFIITMSKMYFEKSIVINSVSKLYVSPQKHTLNLSMWCNFNSIITQRLKRSLLTDMNLSGINESLEFLNNNFDFLLTAK